MVSNAFVGRIYVSTRPKTGIDAQKFSRKNWGDPRTLNEKCPDARWMDRWVPQRRCGPVLQTWTLEDIWGPRTSMQVVDRTIAGWLLVQLDRVRGQEAGLVDPPGNDGDMVAEMGGDGASKGDAVVKHHMRVVHDDVGCGVRLLNGCKESKHETKECKINFKMRS